MTLHYLRKQPSFSAVAAGSTASVIVPRGPTYRNFVLKYGTATAGGPTEANMKAEIDMVRVKINSIVRFELSGTHLLDLMHHYYGRTVAAGLMVIPFARPWHRTIPGEENLALGTRNIDTLEVEVDINSGATTPTLELQAQVDPVLRDLGQIVEVHKTTLQPAATGVYEWSQIPRSQGDLLAMHLDESSAAVITAIEVWMNSVGFSDGDLDVIDWLQKNEPHGIVRAPVANYRHIDTAILNRVDDRWPLRAIEDFRLKVTLSTAGAIPVIMETLNAPLGLSEVA
jgi:hypothetical protein